MSRTPYSGRKYTREQLLDAWEKSTSINDCISRLNMRVSGAAYKSISKILAYEGLIPEPVATKTSYASPLTYDQSPDENGTIQPPASSFSKSKVLS